MPILICVLLRPGEADYVGDQSEHVDSTFDLKLNGCNRTSALMEGLLPNCY